MTPMVHLELLISLRIFEKNRNGSNGILRGLGKTDSYKTWSQKSRGTVHLKWRVTTTKTKNLQRYKIFVVVLKEKIKRPSRLDSFQKINQALLPKIPVLWADKYYKYIKTLSGTPFMHLLMRCTISKRTLATGPKAPVTSSGKWPTVHKIKNN